MQIKPYTIADLRTVLSSNDFWRTETLPITKQRALAHIHNPRAQSEDIVLFVAYQDNDVIGYLGILPDRIFIADKAYKLGWLTGWWVNPRRALTGVGTALLFKALNAYNQQVGVSGNSKDAGKVLQASQKFIAINPLRGLDITFDSNPGLQGRKGRIADLDFEYIASIDKETGALIKRHNIRDLTRKNKADLDWVMTYPWLLSAPWKDNLSKKYYFSSIAKRFSYLGVKVFQRDKGLIGYFVIKARDDKMALLYAYFDSEDGDAVSAAVVHHAQAMDATVLSLYEQRLLASLPGLDYSFSSSKSVSRGFLLTKPFADKAWADCRLQGGDGDLAFY